MWIKQIPILSNSHLSRVFMQPLRHLGFDHNVLTTTTTEAPKMENLYQNLTKEDCERKVDQDPLPPMPKWFFYPENSECYHFAIWEHFQMVKWKPEWYRSLCDHTYKTHKLIKSRELKEVLKGTHCKSD